MVNVFFYKFVGFASLFSGGDGSNSDKRLHHPQQINLSISINKKAKNKSLYNYWRTLTVYIVFCSGPASSKHKRVERSSDKRVHHPQQIYLFISTNNKAKNKSLSILLNVHIDPCFEDKSSSLTLKYRPVHFSENSCM